LWVTPRVLVLTRAGCHLCDQAIEVVAAVCSEVGEAYATRDIDADPELREKYTDQVPVTFVDGAQHDFWRVDPVRLRAALGRPRPAVNHEGGRPSSDPPHKI
jgi:glutaredoxin